MPGMDIFDSASGAFNTRTLTAMVNEIPYVPGQLSSLGIWEEAGEPTTRLSIEREGASLALVPTTPRGGPAIANRPDKRSLIDLEVVHLEMADTVNADEVQGVREFGFDNRLSNVVAMIRRKQTAMVRKLDATMEYHRLGALNGQVLDADGVSVLFDYFAAFGEAAHAVVDFDLDNANPASGALRGVCSQVIRDIAAALGGLPWTSIHALCGPLFFDQFVAHPEFRETHVQRDAMVLRAGVPYTQFTFGGITFEEYRGPTGTPGYSGPTFIEDGEVRIFPVGVPGLFISRYGPADYVDTVNTMGSPRYSDARPDPSAPRKRAIIEVQTNPIHICTRPRVLIRGTNS